VSVPASSPEKATASAEEKARDRGVERRK